MDRQNAKGLGRLRSFVRKAVFSDDYRSFNYVPITFLNDGSPPKLTGKRGAHFTMGGSPIDHPSSYRKTGWSNMTYRTSTFSISVGKDWVIGELSANKKVGPNLSSMLWSEDKDSVRLALMLLGLL